jgi:hypothetical protein
LSPGHFLIPVTGPRAAARARREKCRRRRQVSLVRHEHHREHRCKHDSQRRDHQAQAALFQAPHLLFFKTVTTTEWSMNSMVNADLGSLGGCYQATHLPLIVIHSIPKNSPKKNFPKFFKKAPFGRP